jgi:hypothetical protein
MPSGSRAHGIPIPDRDPVPLRPFRQHPRPTQLALLFKPHPLGRRERRFVIRMRRPLHAPEAQPAAPPGRGAAGQLEAVVQEEADGVAGHVGASEFREHDHPRHLRGQIHGRRVDQPDHARERVAAGLVDDGEKDAHGVATHEGFDLCEDRVERREVEREPAVEIGMGFDFVRVASSVERRDKWSQFDAVGFECGLVEGHHPVDIVWVWAIVPRWERGVVRLVRIRERHGCREVEERMR